jgi:hypothetical protein
MARTKRKLRIVLRKLGRHKAVGIYWTPHRSDGTPVIEIDPRQEAKAELDTVIHEGLHHCFPDLTEAQVSAAAADLTEIQWALGYRRVKQ